VADLSSGIVMAQVASPAAWSVHNVWFAVLRDPSGRAYPFIAPSYYYYNPVGTQFDLWVNGARAPWSFLCQFDPGRIPALGGGHQTDPACGTGFQSATTSLQAEDVQGTPIGPNDHIFRHAGGLVSDVDGDGWGDITVPYQWFYKTISGRTHQRIG